MEKVVLGGREFHPATLFTPQWESPADHMTEDDFFEPVVRPEPRYTVQGFAKALEELPLGAAVWPMLPKKRAHAWQLADRLMEMMLRDELGEPFDFVGYSMSEDEPYGDEAFRILLDVAMSRLLDSSGPGRPLLTGEDPLILDEAFRSGLGLVKTYKPGTLPVVTSSSEPRRLTHAFAYNASGFIVGFDVLGDRKLEEV